jgi:hypothetical protein
MVAPLMMSVSVLLLLCGMVGGILMGMTQNFALAPAHAHLNLVGGVLLFLYGLYYRVVPAAGAMTLAKIQGYTHIAGAILFPIGIAIVLTRGPSAEVFPILGSFIVLAATIMFAIVVFRTARV